VSKKRFDPKDATPAEIAAAREQYGSNDVEIDEGAAASRADNGVWVAAWVWLSNKDVT
jgi:hypothetical protein